MPEHNTSNKNRSRTFHRRIEREGSFDRFLGSELGTKALPPKKSSSVASSRQQTKRKQPGPHNPITLRIQLTFFRSFDLRAKRTNYFKSKSLSSGNSRTERKRESWGGSPCGRRQCTSIKWPNRKMGIQFKPFFINKIKYNFVGGYFSNNK